VHISEEASNASTAVPWAIVGAISTAGLLGWGESHVIIIFPRFDRSTTLILAINMALAFCMGPDLQALNNSEQPMAQILLNSFGQKGTLGIWVVVVLVQYVSFWSTLHRTGSFYLHLSITHQIHDGIKHGELTGIIFLLPALTTIKLLAASRQTFAFSRDGGSFYSYNR
jgi:amino acid transporter